MGAKTFSTDLRIRVIKHIERGNTQRDTAALFSVSTSAVNRWWRRYKEEGSLLAKPKLGSKGKVDQQALEDYVKKHPDKTLNEIAQVFNVTITAIWKWLRKLGFSYKKKRSPTWKQIKKSDRLT